MLTLGFYQYKVSANQFARDNGANADTVAFTLGQGVTELVGDVALGAATGGLGLVKHCGTFGAKMLKVAQGVIKAADAVHTAKAAHDMVVHGDPSFAIIALFKVGGHGLGMTVAKIRGPKCFIAGTQVLSQDETGQAAPTNIEEIEAGDLVWSRDEHTGEESFKVVVETYIRETDELIHLTYATEGTGARPARRSLGESGSASDGLAAEQSWTLGGSSATGTTATLTGTAEHPFWSLTQAKWVDMGKLHVGERLSLTTGPATVTAVQLCSTE